MAQFTVFGKDIKKRLIDLEHTQVWLIEQVRQTTGLYFDDSYLYKIQTGQLATPKIVSAIRDILVARRRKGSGITHEPALAIEFW